MWRCVIAVAWVACVAAADAAAHTLYAKPGQDVVLKPISVPDIKQSIAWKHDDNLAMDLTGELLDSYRQFKDRGRLNTSSAELTIVKVAPEDNGTYTVEFDGKQNSQTHLIVIAAVPVPKVVITCDDAKTICTLDCVGSTAGAEPVGYTWRLGDLSKENSDKEYSVKKEDASEAAKFSCELHNPVSKESSPLYDNPFEDSPGEGSLYGKIYTGLAVFLSLLSAVVLLVSVHKCKTGMWFYEKTSMPWESDFWEKTRLDASVSNGAATRQQEYEDEETPMNT